MNFMKKYVKNLLLAILFIAVFIASGVQLIGKISDLELRKSTYTRTAFDYHIAAPDKQQVEEIEGVDTVERVFAYYAYKKAFSKAKDVTLLVSDDMDDYAASLLTEKTLIKGSYAQNGAMLDKTAADELHVGIGDRITFNLMGNTFTKTVAAIYLPSTFTLLEDGIVLVDLSADMASVHLPKAYGGAFVEARDKDGVGALLSDYVGEGNVALTYEQYVELYCGTPLPGQTAEEYETYCKTKYEAYRADALAAAKRGGGQVVDKMDAYALLKEKIRTREKENAEFTTWMVIASILIFAAAHVIFMAANAANDRILRDSGMRAQKMFFTYALQALIAALAIALITGIVLYTVASQTYFLAEILSTVLWFSLPVLAGALLFTAVAAVYVGTLYKNRMSK